MTLIMFILRRVILTVAGNKYGHIWVACGYLVVVPPAIPAVDYLFGRLGWNCLSPRADSFEMENDIVQDSSQVKQEIAELIAHIDDSDDLTHSDYTVAVLKLADIGLPSLRNGVLELLLSENELTRTHAQVVLERVSGTVTGYRKGGQLDDDPKLKEKWEALWKKNGSYDSNAKSDQRAASYIKWIKWVRSQH